jgi:hypothetical protein
MGKLKINEIGRVKFARDLKGKLGPAAAKWEHHEAVQAEEPLGRYCTEVTDSDRVGWMSNPEELTKFIVRSTEELMELAPAIDSVLARLRTK